MWMLIFNESFYINSEYDGLAYFRVSIYSSCPCFYGLIVMARIIKHTIYMMYTHYLIVILMCSVSMCLPFVWIIIDWGNKTWYIHMYMYIQLSHGRYVIVMCSTVSAYYCLFIHAWILFWKNKKNDDLLKFQDKSSFFLEVHSLWI